MKIVVLLTWLAFVVAEPNYVTRKLCKDVDVTQCTIHSMIMDPCAKGLPFCAMKINKAYSVTLDLVPHFSSTKLKLSVSADVDNSGNFTTKIKSETDACNMLYCPLRSEERRIFDVDMSLDKTASGKFPMKIMMWNEEKASEACCVTFTVKVK